MQPETATAVSRSPVSCTITARGHHLVQDKPANLGGSDGGMMASELLLASLLACQLSTSAKIIAKRRLTATVQDIAATVHYDEAGDIGGIALAWRIAGADDKQAATLTRLTDRACTISRALQVPITSDHSIV